MNKTHHFITGLPRSGSTLLAAILRQNPRFHADIISPIYPILKATQTTMGPSNEAGIFIDKQQQVDILRGIFNGYYGGSSKDVIFDTHRMWTASIHTLQQLYPNTKLIACVRDVAWIMDSFERAVHNNALKSTRLFTPEEGVNVYTRTSTLALGHKQVGSVWNALREAYYGDLSKNLMLIDYEVLAQRPEATLNLLYDFIEEPRYAHDFDNVYYEAKAFDDTLGVENLHKVEGKVEYRERTTILPPDVFKKYAGQTFWRKDLNTQARVLFPQ